MFKYLKMFHSEDMAVALTLWLCSLPLVGLLVIPFFGWEVALGVALALFLAAMVICWGICGWKISTDRIPGE
jgi:hypothetical protein